MKDRKHLFEDGYSGEIALANNTNGKGIGMYRAKRLLEQSGSRLVIDYGDEAYDYNGIMYSKNIFSILIPLL